MPTLPITPANVIAKSGAATLNQDAGTITTESLSTAGVSTYTLTIGCDQATANSVVLASVTYNTCTQGDPAVARILVKSGVITIVIANRAASTALNGTLNIGVVIFN